MSAKEIAEGMVVVEGRIERDMVDGIFESIVGEDEEACFGGRRGGGEGEGRGGGDEA